MDIINDRYHKNIEQAIWVPYAVHTVLLYLLCVFLLYK